METSMPGGFGSPNEMDEDANEVLQSVRDSVQEVWV